jgi:putative sigma-54 modulation protein
MTINLRATDMELTPAIRQYAEDKMNSLEKYSADIQQVDIVIGLTSAHHQKGDVHMCSVSVQIPGDILKIERSAEDLYKAIDKVRDHLRETLAQRKERMVDARKQG